MKSSTRSILFTAVLAIVATTSMAAQSSNNWSEQWYRAKFGRPSPLEVARLQADQANTAYREEKPGQLAVPANTWFEGWYRAKYGRPSPTEVTRLEADQTNTAYREEAFGPIVVPGNSGFEGWYRAKYGRPSPLVDAR